MCLFCFFFVWYCVCAASPLTSSTSATSSSRKTTLSLPFSLYLCLFLSLWYDDNIYMFCVLLLLLCFFFGWCESSTTVGVSKRSTARPPCGMEHVCVWVCEGINFTMPQGKGRRERGRERVRERIHGQAKERVKIAHEGDERRESTPRRSCVPISMRTPEKKMRKKNQSACAS